MPGEALVFIIASYMLAWVGLGWLGLAWVGLGWLGWAWVGLNGRGCGAFVVYPCTACGARVLW